MTRVRLGVIIAVVASLVTIGLFVVLRHNAKTTKLPAGAIEVTIPAKDGAGIKAVVIKPEQTSGKKYPVVVMPGSWGSAANEYAKVGKVFADHGWVVVSYAQRGFGGSGGQVDLAGEPTQTDATTVIDWAVANAHADPAQVGIVGASYGAGVSLLAAERDPRIKAVVSISGWASLPGAVDANNTVSSFVLKNLFMSGTNRDMSLPIVAARSGLRNNNPTQAAQLVNDPVRSAMTNIAALNRNKTAVLLSNTYQDAIMPPAQVIPFFDALTVPKRVEFEYGGHAGPAVEGLKGGAAASQGIWKDALDWIDHYVRGIDNGIDKQPPVHLKDGLNGTWHTYASLAAASKSTSTLNLASTNAQQPGSLAGAASAWSRTISTGKLTPADAGIFDFNTVGLGVVYPATINQANGATFTSSPAPQPTLVSGEPSFTVTVTPSSNTATFYTYLYDVAPNGQGSMVTFNPYTITGATPNSPTTITVNLRAIEWNLVAGHSLSLVIDTVDARYIALNPRGSTLTFSSTAAQPAKLEIPIGA